MFWASLARLSSYGLTVMALSCALTGLFAWFFPEVLSAVTPGAFRGIALDVSAAAGCGGSGLLGCLTLAGLGVWFWTLASLRVLEVDGDQARLLEAQINQQARLRARGLRRF